MHARPPRALVHLSIIHGALIVPTGFGEYGDMPHGRALSLRRWYSSLTLGGKETIVLALVLFVGVLVLRESDANVADADEMLFVLPIALLAMRFGFRGGLAGGLLALALMGTWDVLGHGMRLTVAGYLIRGIAALLLGTLLGIFVDQRRTLEAEVSRYYNASLDLLATIDLSGRFTRVNPAWERTLGYCASAILSHPTSEFVHPDDYEATTAEHTALTIGSHDTIGFRNRWRAADGSYRWLEWSATCSPAEGVVHVIGRDITAQREAEQQLASNAEWLDAKVAERTRELDGARAENLKRLALAAEFRDDDTAQHTERVGVTAAAIAVRLGLGAEEIKLLREAAPLHDVGKLAIPDSILLKPGRLTPQEYEVMKTHAALGALLLSDSSSPVLQMATVIAATHHERWDGTGYPAGLAGEAIPLVGRVVAVADVFDALTHDRPYKSAWPVEQAIAEVQRAAGSQFDPRVVAAFVATRKQTAVSAAVAGDTARRRRRTIVRPATAPSSRVVRA
jgi:PAS domain S-box-containing protein